MKPIILQVKHEIMAAPTLLWQIDFLPGAFLLPVPGWLQQTALEAASKGQFDTCSLSCMEPSMGCPGPWRAVTGSVGVSCSPFQARTAI